MQRSTTILMIEEDAAGRFMMRQIGRALDIQIETARCYAEGLRQLRESPLQFAMIIMNVPRCLTKTDVAVRSIRTDARSEVRDIPIIGMTEKNQVLDNVSGHIYDMDEYLHKPLTPVELLSLLDRYSEPAAAKR